MDKNFKQKVKGFFKKEGIFVALFVCLCVVTMVAAVTIKKANVGSNEPPAVEENENELTVNTEEKPNVTVPTNAENVNKGKNETKTVSTNNNVVFTKPVEGVISREYTTKTIKMSDAERRTVRGFNIEAKAGTEVKAAAEGVVEFAGDTGVEYGVVVAVKHANGLITKYCNLDKNLSVKKGDKVTNSTVLGKVGNSSKIFTSNQFGEHLNLQVWNGDKEVNPTAYFPSYTVKK